MSVTEIIFVTGKHSVIERIFSYRKNSATEAIDMNYVDQDLLLS